jgi:hypothetical protein
MVHDLLNGSSGADARKSARAEIVARGVIT